MVDPPLFCGVPTYAVVAPAAPAGVPQTPNDAAAPWRGGRRQAQRAGHGGALGDGCIAGELLGKLFPGWEPLGREFFVSIFAWKCCAKGFCAMWVPVYATFAGHASFRKWVAFGTHSYPLGKLS